MALSFGAAEYFSLMVLGLIAAVVLAQGASLKAVAMIFVGLFLGLVGTDVNTGGSASPSDMPELVRRHRLRADRDRPVRHRRDHRQPVDSPTSAAFCRQTITRLDADAGRISRRALPAILRGTGLGSILGVLPGGGALLSSFAAYTLEKKLSKTPERFGQGAIEGVAAPEVGQQCRRADLLHSAADARHPAQSRDGADDRRHDDPRHPARTAGDD